MAEISDLIKYMQSDSMARRKEEKEAIERDKKQLELLKKSIEDAGGQASDDAKYRKADIAIQQRELNLRKKGATGAAAKEEIEKEQQKINQKQNTLLFRISEGIGGILGNMKDKAKAAGKTFMDILKGTLLAGLFFAAAKFFNSPLYAEMIDFITNTLVPSIQRFYTGTLKPFFLGIATFIKDPTFENFKKIFDVDNPLGLVAALAGVTALLAPGLVFKGLKAGVGLFTKAVTAAGSFLGQKGTDVLTGTKKDATGRVRTSGGQFAKGSARGIGAIAKGALRFAGPIGVAVTAGMGLFDGITAGIEEYKKSGKVGAAVKEGFSGAISGLTFGFFSQEDVSAGLTAISDKTKAGFEKAKNAIGSVFSPDAQWAKDLTASTSKQLSDLKEASAKLVEKLPSLDDLKEFGGDLKEKFEGLKDKASAFIGNIGDKIKGVIDKMPSISEVGDKISGFFGFGDDKDDAKKLEETARTVAAFEQERQQLNSKVLSLEDQLAQQAAQGSARLAELEQKLQALQENALARNGTSAPNININAPSDNKVTQSTSNTTSNTTTIVNTDPILQAAMI